MTLRDYQTSARYQINTLLNASRHPLYVAPTGTGKTKTAVAVIQDRIKLNQKVCITAPQVEIFDQWCKELSAHDIEYGLINDKGISGKNRKVYISMPLSLNNILPYLPSNFRFDEIIDDEAHLTGAETYQSIHRHFDYARKLGLTATPYRYDNKPLGITYTDLIQTITAQEAIDRKYLSKPLTILPEQYLNDVPINNGDYDPEVQAELLGKTKIIGNIIEWYNNIFCGQPVMCACATNKHAQQMTEEFKKAGWIFEHLHSGLSRGERARIIRRTRAGALDGICTVGVGVLGLDIPGLYGGLWLSRTLSLTKFLQFTGRWLRPLDGKEYGVTLDFVGNTHIHGRPELDRQWSLESDYKPNEGDKAPRMRICPICGVMNAYENLKCHICGGDLNQINGKNTRKLPVMCDGKLVVLDSVDGAEWLANRIQQKKVENEIQIESEKKVELIEVTRDQKKIILNRNLTGKKVESIFQETLSKYISDDKFTNVKKVKNFVDQEEKNYCNVCKKTKKCDSVLMAVFTTSDSKTGKCPHYEPSIK